MYALIAVDELRDAEIDANAITSAQLLMFFAVMLRSYIKGLGIDCGRFGVGEALTPKTLARDGLLLGCAIVLTVSAFTARRYEPERIRSNR